MFGQVSGIKDYHFTSVELRSGQEIEVDYNIQVDVLRQIPVIKNYIVREDTSNSKLYISFNLEDVDSAFVSGDYTITEEINETEQTTENTELVGGRIEVGENNIEFTAEENKKYNLSLCIRYDLDSNELENDTEDHSSSVLDNKILQIITDFEFKLSDVATYRIDDENLVANTEFYKRENIAIRFNNSVNTTEFLPTQAVINGKMYDLIKLENQTVYQAIVDGFEEAGNHELNIEKVILDNGKQIDVDNRVELVITKTMPTVQYTESRKDVEKKIFDSTVYLYDTDEAIKKITVSLFDENDNVIAENVDYTEQFKNSITSNDEVCMFNVRLNIDNFLMADKYKFKIFADYSLIEGIDKKNELIYSEEFDTSPVVAINNVSVSNKYPEKGENVVVSYEIETNKKKLPIIGIMLNNTRCIPTKKTDETGKVTYEVIIGVGNDAGEVDLKTTEFIFEGGLTARVSNTAKVEVLKDKPTSEAFTQVDHISNGKGKVTLTANIKDPDKALISGWAELIEVGKENEETPEDRIKTFDAEHITFEIDNLELNTEYKLIARMTYDRDNDINNGLNSVVDEVFRERQIQLIADYNLEISNVKTYSEQKETKYFAKNEEVFVAFNSSNSTIFYPQKAVINGQEYTLIKIGEEYRAALSGYERFGPQDIVIEKIILNNTKELILDRNNTTKIGILKDVPAVSNFGYAEGENDTINVSFKINDEEHAIERRKCYSI